MKVTRCPILILLVLFVVACGTLPQAIQPISPILDLSPTPQPSLGIPTPTWAVSNQGISWAQVDFKDLTPSYISPQQGWNALGMDDKGRVYIGFTSLRNDGRDDFAVFCYDPASGAREFLGTFIDIAQAAGNLKEGESIPKGHTRMIFADDMLYMASQGFHDLKQSIASLPTYRGSHLFAFDTDARTWRDLAANLPGGVVTPHEGIVSLNILPKEHLLVGLAHPSSDIVFFDYRIDQVIKIAPGIPWKLGNPLSREVIVAPSGNIYTYCGTEPPPDRHQTHSVWVYNVYTGVMKDTGFEMTNGFWIGQTQKADGSKIYINTTGGELYEFDVTTETFKDLGYELPKSDPRTIDYTYSITLSPDEKRLYYVLSVIHEAGNEDSNGIGGTGELYYYDLYIGQVVFLQQLLPGIYTSQDIRDDENIYLSHFGTNRNIWSGDPRLFILHVPPESMK